MNATIANDLPKLLKTEHLKALFGAFPTEYFRTFAPILDQHSSTRKVMASAF